ncbi:ribonuclease HI [Escherichia phage EJP2]|nr:ribonuclease HI [Escherichia phage EJP2]
MTTFTLYTDGSCLGNPGPGGVGIVVLKDGVEDARLSFGEAHTTNNRMELMASLSGIAYVKETYGYDSKIKVISDSKYVVDGMTAWRHGWKKKNWSGCNKNLDIWQQIDILGDDCEFQWVKAHNKDFYNEIADELARTAAQEISKSQ